MDQNGFFNSSFFTDDFSLEEKPLWDVNRAGAERAAASPTSCGLHLDCPFHACHSKMIFVSDYSKFALSKEYAEECDQPVNPCEVPRFFCDKCGQIIGYGWHCKKEGHDLCMSCAKTRMTCPSGHALLRYKFPSHDLREFVCDECEQDLGSTCGDAGNVTYFCKGCEYDVCQKCYMKKLEAYLSPKNSKMDEMDVETQPVPRRCNGLTNTVVDILMRLKKNGVMFQLGYGAISAMVAKGASEEDQPNVLMALMGCADMCKAMQQLDGGTFCSESVGIMGGAMLAIRDGALDNPYVEDVKKTLRATVVPLTEEAINQWMHQNTAGAMRGSLQLSENTTLVMMAAGVAMAKYAEPAALDEDFQFQTSGGRTVQCGAAVHEEQTKYVDNDEVRAAAIKCNTTIDTFVVWVMPKKDDVDVNKAAMEAVHANKKAVKVITPNFAVAAKINMTEMVEKVVGSTMSLPKIGPDAILGQAAVQTVMQVNCLGLKASGTVFAEVKTRSATKQLRFDQPCICMYCVSYQGHFAPIYTAYVADPTIMPVP